MRNQNKKINELIYRPLEGDTGGVPKNLKNKSMKQRNMNGPETNLNGMPDLTTFDNRATTDSHKLLNQKAKRKKKKGMPNKSMRNLNKESEDVLPVYKRRAYNKGPIKIGDRSYMNHPLKTHYSSKRQNAWITEQNNISGEENINELNNNQPVKARVMKSSRQQNDFRINKNKSKGRGKTSQGPRNLAKSALPSNNDLNGKKPASTLYQKDKISNSRKKRAQAAEKRAQSMNHQRMKATKNLNTGSSNIFEEIDQFKQEFRELEE